jgi:hypothetical protein
MKFYITYSNSHRAKEKGWPEQGTEVDIATLEDLEGFISQYDSKAILFTPGHEPGWILGFPSYGDPKDWLEDREFHYCVWPLPDAPTRLRWIEVYNGYRE